MGATPSALVRSTWLPSWLPRGGSLPEDLWRARHRGVLVLLWVHAGVVPVFAVIRGFSVSHALAEGAIIPALAVLAAVVRSRRACTALASIGLLTSSAILVHLSGGVIEMHFHFFVMVAVVALYQEWVPFLAAIGYVLVHHGVMGAVDADSVYNHPAAWRDPWKWAAIHAFFIAGISVACLITWGLNERALDERREAEDRLREESRIVETLHAVGQTLAMDLDTERVIQTVTDAGTQLTGARFGAFFYNVVDDTSGDSYLMYTLSGEPKEAFDGFPMPRKTAVFAPTFEGAGVIRLDDVTADPRYGQMAPHHGLPPGHLPVRSYLAVPVRSRTGEVLGGLFFGHPEPAMFDDVDERIATGIAAHASIAVDNARLFESERHARTTSESAHERLALLAEASRALTSSLELGEILRDVAALVTGAGVDHCAIDLVEPEGRLRRVVASAPGTGGCERFSARPPALGDDAHPVVRAIRSQRPAWLTASGAEAVDGAGDMSLIAVPVIGRHEVLGAISLGAEPASGRPLGRADVELAEELARRLGLAVENARLYMRQRSVAETLQHSLLPERLPEIPGFVAAVRYLPGADVDVGGDWYDLLQLQGGVIALTMGDVVGRGERAAALMGQLRTAVRAYSLDGRSPKEVVERVNTMLIDAGNEYMATLVHLLVDPETGELRVVNGGHPPPLVIRKHGATEFLDGSGGLPVGAMASSRYGESRFQLGEGDTVVLYTDGLVESRVLPLADGLERLRRAAADVGPGIDPEVLCDRLLEDLRDEARPSDDTAVLAFRLCRIDADLHLRVPAQPSVLAPLRATLRRWLVQSGANEQEIYELLVAAGEACSNAIRHATGPRAAHFDVVATCDGIVEILVRDEGTWRPAQRSEGGRGMGIIETFVDELEVVAGEEGTEVRMRRRLMETAAVR